MCGQNFYHLLALACFFFPCIFIGHLSPDLHFFFTKLENMKHHKHTHSMNRTWQVDKNPLGVFDTRPVHFGARHCEEVLNFATCYISVNYVCWSCSQTFFFFFNSKSSQMNPEFCLFEATNSKVQLGGVTASTLHLCRSQNVNNKKWKKIFQNNSG